MAEAGQTNQALQEWDEALRIQPNNAAAQANRAYALLQVGRKTEAFEGWERALKIDPDLSSAHYDYGVALMQSGEIDPAIQHLDRALQLGRNDPAVHYRMGLALNRQENSPAGHCSLPQSPGTRRPSFSGGQVCAGLAARDLSGTSLAKRR